MTTNLTPAERKLRAKHAADSRWARPGARKRQSQTIRERRIELHEQRIDPEGKLDPAERRKCAESALAAEMAKLSFEASKARRAKAEGENR